MVMMPLMVMGVAGCGGGSTSDAGAGEASETSAVSETSAAVGAGVEFPAEVRQNFLSNCTASAAATSGGDEAAFEDLCLCVLEQIESDMTFDEFAEAEQAMVAGEDSGLDMQALVGQCAGA